jgi:hypothetical protein
VLFSSLSDILIEALLIHICVVITASHIHSQSLT